MARFVLVHGAFAGAWIWGPLMDRLKAAGHAVEAFDLPGLGDDRTPASEITLESCSRRLSDLLARSSEPAVVAGNSMGASSQPREQHAVPTASWHWSMWQRSCQRTDRVYLT